MKNSLTAAAAKFARVDPGGRIGDAMERDLDTLRATVGVVEAMVASGERTKAAVAGAAVRLVEAYAAREATRDEERAVLIASATAAAATRRISVIRDPETGRTVGYETAGGVVDAAGELEDDGSLEPAEYRRRLDELLRRTEGGL
jgi:hypothetical protein